MKVKYIGMGGYIDTPVYEDENGRLYFDTNNGYGELELSTGAYRDEDGFIDGEPASAVTEPVECDNPYKVHPHRYSYMLLGRLQTDCKYYINCNGCSKNNLWSDIDTILSEMEAILNSFSKDEKPEWLTDQQFTELKNKVREVQKGCEEKEALELADMTYTEFLSNIDKYVGYVVEFKTRFKSNGKIFTSQRYVWDNKEFGALKPDSLIEVLSVKILYKKETKRTESGINY